MTSFNPLLVVSANMPAEWLFVLYTAPHLLYMRKWHANELETFNVLSIHQLRTYPQAFTSGLAHVRFEITPNVHASGWAIFI